MWKTKYLKFSSVLLLLGLLGFLTVLMITITLEYFPIRTDIAFLKIKQWVFRNYQSGISNFWFTAFYVHVITSSFCLLAGFTQFFRRTIVKGLHRKLGIFYMVVVLGFAAPSGLIMSFFANGGAISVAAFMTLSLLWIFTTAMAWRTAKQKNFAQHGAWVILSYSLTLSALTLRAWKWGLVNLTDLDLRPMDLYRVVAWLGWVPNFLVALILVKMKTHFSLIKSMRL